MANNMIVGYSPHDFFYVDAENRNMMPSDEKCKELKPDDQKWNSECGEHFKDNSGNCIAKELCKNREKAVFLQSLENSHSGSTEKYMNEKMNYDNVIMNTINLGIGILFLIVIIYKNQK
jgi:hypothetical protein